MVIALLVNIFFGKTFIFQVYVYHAIVFDAIKYYLIFWTGSLHRDKRLAIRNKVISLFLLEI